jgi:hypothetical protein
MSNAPTQSGKAKRPRARIRRNAQTRASVELDSILKRILASIATLLVTSGSGISRVNELTKLAFVKAAESINRAEGKKTSIARIAASTGLTRIEVSRLLKAPNFHHTTRFDAENRVVRVAEGWISDAAYVDAKGNPLVLQFDGPGNTFSKLVKKYSGDIPARAMLAEMRRLRLVSNTGGDCVRLLRSDIRISRRTVAALNAISPWVRFLARAADHVDLSSNVIQFHINVSSVSQVNAAIRELSARRDVFIEGIKQLSTCTPSASKYDIAVSVAVATAEPTRRKTKAKS